MPDTLPAAPRARRLRTIGDPAVLAWCVVLATVVIGPMASRGWVVLLDWVTGPRVDFADRITAGSSLPAGPVFFVLAAMLHALFGAAVGWMLPWTLLVIAGIGAARLAATVVASRAGKLTAATAYLWNPFVHERLYSGQLAVLAGYAILPFMLAAAIAPVTGREDPDPVAAALGRTRGVVAKSLALSATWAVAAACSIHFAVLGGVLVAAVAITPRLQEGGRKGDGLPVRWLAAAAFGTAVVTAAWLVPRLGSAPPTGDDRTIRAFATRGDPSLGLSGGVAFQRGFWRSSPGGPGSNVGWWWPLVAGLLAGAALIGLHALWREGSRRIVVSVAIIGVVGWFLGQGPDGLAGPVFTAATRLPGMRVMREGGKFIALVSLLWTVGLAGCAELVWSRFSAEQGHTDPGRFGRAVVVVACAVAPIALTPGLAGAVGGRLEAVRYPRSWSALAAALDRRPEGQVIVLPFIGYFDPGFTNGRIVKHPSRAFFGPRVVLSDDAEVPGLDPSARTREIASALTSNDVAPRLAAQGIGWVIGVSQPAPIPGDGFKRVAQSGGWTLYRNTAFVPEPRVRS